jgi:hypothetical protein
LQHFLDNDFGRQVIRSKLSSLGLGGSAAEARSKLEICITSLNRTVKSGAAGETSVSAVFHRQVENPVEIAPSPVGEGTQFMGLSRLAQEYSKGCEARSNWRNSQ